MIVIILHAFKLPQVSYYLGKKRCITTVISLHQGLAEKSTSGNNTQRGKTWLQASLFTSSVVRKFYRSEILLLSKNRPQHSTHKSHTINQQVLQLEHIRKFNLRRSLVVESTLGTSEETMSPLAEDFCKVSPCAQPARIFRDQILKQQVFYHQKRSFLGVSYPQKDVTDDSSKFMCKKGNAAKVMVNHGYSGQVLNMSW